MENLILKLKNGKKVTVEGFTVNPTYAGLILGQPNATINNEILKRTTFPCEWGERKVVFKQNDQKISKSELKPFIFSTWLSSEPINDKKNKYFGSSIVLVWCGNNPKNKTIEEIILVQLEKFDWERYAENFNP